MRNLIDIISDEMSLCFEKAGYDPVYAKVSVSDRPDLCDFQCNGAMAAKKEYKKSPHDIASNVMTASSEASLIFDMQTAGPGFLNITLKNEFLVCYLNEMAAADKFGIENPKAPETIVLDYGGPNVAKPLHVGHLRSAIIGESVKRICRFMNDVVISDVHLGDWGLQMGLIIALLEERQPELPYFDPDFDAEYPSDPPFTISQLEEIYPAASLKSKNDDDFRKKALEATRELQNGRRGYSALWNHIMNVSVTDLKKNYNKLGVEFDLWKKESDAQKYIPEMIQKMKDDGFAYVNEGALIVDVNEDSDTKEVPPCILLKSDGSSLYATTDLATIVERVKLFDPDRIIYVVDKRQDMHFIQVFRCAKKTGLVKPGTKLYHLGFGTMNGKDGKPFKTRDGGVMRLEELIDGINEKMYVKIIDNKDSKDNDTKRTAEIVSLAAIKYADLSNQAAKDYIFDPDRFTSFEGNTGPYILYTIVRIKSILEKYVQSGESPKTCRVGSVYSESERKLMLRCALFGSAVINAYEEMAPHKICAYIYALSNDLNHFYHETKILTEKDEEKKKSRIALLELAKRILETGIRLLGFCAPDRM